MKILKKSERLTQVKEGRKIIFEVMSNRSGTKFNSFKNGLGIVLDSESLEECIEQTFERIEMINEDFKNRLISL